MFTDRVTVVIATHNRRDELLRHLPRHEGPVVVVDNASTDGTADAVEARFPRVKVVRLTQNVGGRARTVGACAARTEYVAFADDDSWWEPGALDRAERLFDAHPRLGLVAGRITVGEDRRSDPINDVLATSPIPARDRSLRPALLGFVACAAVVRLDAFFAAGGFDEVVRFPGEEERLALDLDDAGWSIAYAPEVVAHHEPSTQREDDAVRARGLIRSRVLTAVLRRPWADVRAEVARAARTVSGARALLEASVRLPRALELRRVVGASTRERLALLEPAAAGSSAPPATVRPAT